MPVQRFDSFTLRYSQRSPGEVDEFVMSEFDSEEIVISQYSLQTKGALAEWIYAPE